MTKLLENLERLLSVKRGHGGAGEAETVAWLCSQVTPTMIDGAGNIHVKVGVSRTMFTAHTDTVHSVDGVNGIRKEGDFWHADGDPLGADDGAGIALMLHMISAGVPGLFLFPRGEEVGGIGSSWLAQHMPELLQNYDRCISLDRAGYADVITHQGGHRCCSDAFAEALADQLNANGMLYMPCDRGVFTDSANFTAYISEGTNLSVGYAQQHGSQEKQDVKFLQELANALVLVKWEELPTARTLTRTAAHQDPWETVEISALKEDLEDALQNLDVDSLVQIFGYYGFNKSLESLTKHYHFSVHKHADSDSDYRKAAEAWSRGDSKALRSLALDNDEEHIAEALLWGCDLHQKQDSSTTQELLDAQP